MKLKTQVTLVPVAAISILTIGLYLLVSKITVDSFNKLENEILQSQISIVENTFGTLINEHAQKIVDWAQWDRTYEFMVDRSEDYQSENLNALTLQALGYNSVLYLKNDGELYHGVSVSEEKVTEPEPKLVALASSIISKHPSQFFQGIAKVDNQDFIIASSPILPNKGDLPSRGSLVVASKVSEDTFEQVKELTNIDVQFWQLNNSTIDSDLIDAATYIETSGIRNYIKIESPNLIYAYGTISDLFSKSALYFQIKDPRDIVSTGLNVRNKSLVLLSVSGLIAAVLLWLVIHFSVTKRLEKFSRQVTDIAFNANSSGRLLDSNVINRSLRLKTASGMITVFIVLTIITTSMFQKYFLQGFIETEAKLMQGNLQRAKKSLEGRLDKLKAKVIDWAQWDDTYQFIEDHNEQYKEANLGIDTLGPMQMRYVMYFDSSQNLVEGIQIDQNKNSVSPIDNYTVSAVKALQALANAKVPTNSFIKLSSGVILAAASPILDSSREKPSKGAMVFATAADEKLVEELNQQLKLNINLEEPDPNSIYTTPKAIPVDENTISGFATIYDANSNPALNIKVTDKRPVYLQGLIAGKVLPIYFILGGFLCALITVLTIDKLLLRRLKRMSKETDSIKATGDVSQRITSSGNDELSTLANDINQMLVALQNAQIEIAKAKNVAEAANLAKSMFIARVSHELRTPIGGIIGINRIIKKQSELSRGVRNLVDMSDQTAHSLLSVIDEILDYSKAESGELTFENIPFSIRDLIRETMQTISGRLEGKYTSNEKDRISLILDVHPNVPSVLEGDPTKLKQILINLLGNALKFTQKGDVTLTIRSEQAHGSDAMVSFEIADTGIGIPSDQIDNIFKAYKQADPSVHRNYQGTGLGLSIVKQFTEGLKGNVLVKSTLGVGTAFRVTIPFGVISTDDYLLSSERSKINWPRNVVILAEESKSSATLVKNLSMFGLTPKLITPQNGLLLRDTIINSNLLVVFEEIFLNSSYSEILEERVRVNKAGTVAVLSPSLVSIREEWYAKGIDHILGTPVLADDLLLLFAGEKVADSQKTIEPTSNLKFERKLKVLIADDVSTNRMILEDMLVEAGHEVTSVSDGQELVDRLTPMILGKPNAEIFDIVLTDISMPILNGDAATREIRRLERQNNGNIHVPIIAITAHALREEQERIQCSGVDGILVKPMYPEKVEAEFYKIIGSVIHKELN